MCRDIGTSRCWSRVGDVEGPSGCQCCCCGGANPRRSGRPVRPFEVVGYPLGGPIPLGGRHRFRGPVPSAAHIADGDPCRGGRAGGEPTLRAVLPRPRRRPPHRLLAPPTAPPDHRFALHDPAPFRRSGSRGAQREETPEVVLRPVRRRSAQRDVAVRLHPLAPRHRCRHRDHHLARRPFTLRPVRHRTSAHNRPDRRRHLQPNLC